MIPSDVRLRTLLTGLLLSIPIAMPAEKLSTPQLIRMSRTKSAEFRQALVQSLGEEEIRKGTAYAGEGPDFIWVVESIKPPVLYVDDQPLGKMTGLGKNL